MSVMSRYSIRLGLQASCPPSRQGKKGQMVIRLQIHVSMYLLCGMNCTTDNCMEDLDVGVWKSLLLVLLFSKDQLSGLYSYGFQ